MGRFELTGDLVIGFQAIDDHHRTILELGNRVVDPSTIKTNKAVFEDALKYLSDYVIYHFATEEYVMVAIRYPNFDHHLQWHERFKKEISDYANLAATRGMSQDLRFEISFAIENWLLEHVRITDRALVQFMRGKGDDIPTPLPTVRALKDAGRLPKTFDERLIQGVVA